MRPGWVAAPTPSCRPASSPSPASCPATRPSRRSKTRSRRPTATRATRSSSSTTTPSTAPWPISTRSTVPAEITATTKRPPIVSENAPDLVQRVTSVMIAGKGDLLPVSAFPVDGTWPTATTQWEKRNIAIEIPVWDERSLHPVQQVRAGLPPRRHPRQGLRPGRPRGRARDLQVGGLQGQGLRGQEVHHPGGSGRLHRLPALRPGLPRQGQVEPETQVARHGAADAAPRARARQLRFLPRPPRGRPHPGQARCQGLAVPPAALRVLGRLRGLRRDPLRQAPHPALR